MEEAGGGGLLTCTLSNQGTGEVGGPDLHALGHQSMLRCSGMVVIHSPVVCRMKMPFSAASHRGNSENA